MKFHHLKNFLSNPEDVEVSAIEALEHDRFGQPGKDDYRKTAIQMCIKERIDFHNTHNNSFLLLKDCVSLRCPKCDKHMTINNSMAGSGNSFSATYNCTKCNITGTITIPVRGVYFYFE